MKYGIFRNKSATLPARCICAQECPVKIITLTGGSKFPEGIAGAEEKCIKCGHCVAVCPHGAISIIGIKPDDCTPVNNQLHVSADQVEQLIKFRRSIRNYKSKKIDHNLLVKLIDTARYAPTGGNSQQVQWLVIESPKEVKILASKVIEFFKRVVNLGHPFAEKYNFSFLINQWENGNDVIFRGAPALVVAHASKASTSAVVDCSIALSYLDLAATANNLGTCWAGFLMVAASQSRKIQKFMNLPEGNISYGAIMLGEPKYEYHRIPTRKEAHIIWKS